jgi:uncharacterized membrane protein YesL
MNESVPCNEIKEEYRLKGKSGMMGGLYRICEWIMRFSVVNLLWVIFNIPIAYIVLNILFLDETEAMVFFLVPLIILLPFLFFPATTAMFASARDWVIKEESTSVGEYWRYYKENYKKSLFGGLILTVIWTVWAVDYYYFSRENIIIMFVFLIMGIILFVFTINFLSVISHYHLKLLPALKNTLIITIGSPILFLTVLLSSGIILYMGIYVFPLMFPFFTGSLVAYLAFSAFYRFYLNVTSSS